MNPDILSLGGLLRRDVQPYWKEAIPVRVIVTKPRNGTVDLTVEDRRGATGQNWRRKNVPLGELEAQVGAMLERWSTVRAAVKEARKQRLP